ncbi:MAG: UDP-N-acetylmuramoyl-L-alanyl-D-glutamate--2,6-diaminopimelate ligase [Candidatus Omnitrophica bacterium]|nr:UDP-N-acetylmuramoyl-L-alanyl-D-glutamate--2,6-diaminopimelate ligase [Candidatus Omnitrophota bacterium]
MTRVSGLAGARGITANSKDVKKDYIFVAVRGNSLDGGRFIDEDLARGARLIVVDKDISDLKKSAPGAGFLKTGNCREFLARASREFYGDPSAKMRIAGITGTNGKTTVSYLIEAIAAGGGYPCGVIGTINYRFKGKKFAAGNTTPGPERVQELLAGMLKDGVKYCAMEVSSHALDQGRVSGVKFRKAIFTNLTQDHLDYHKNLKNYFLAKAKLFRSLSARSTAVINNDDACGRKLKRLTGAGVMTYGIRRDSDVMARDIVFGIAGTEFTLAVPGKALKIRSLLVGRHNIYNLLAAASWGISEGFKLEDIKAVFEKFRKVPGRLEPAGRGNEKRIFVDYAHTPDALFNVLGALRPLVQGRLIVVFGCGGERDKLKRPLMGKIATDLADFAIITSDNPRSEDPGMIIRDILKGIRKRNYAVAADRKEAIRKGLLMAGRDDCLLVAGKGHEDYQVLKNKKLKFSDRKVISECLKLMK